MNTDAIMVEVANHVTANSDFLLEEVMDALGRFTTIVHFDRNTGEAAAVVLLRGPEIHLYIKPGFRGWFMTRKKIDTVLQAVIDVEGYATTRVQLDMPDKIAFVKRIGFKPTWTDGRCQYFMLTECRSKS